MRRVPGGISPAWATIYRCLPRTGLLTRRFLRSVRTGRQPVQRPRRFVHHTLPQAGGKVARREIRGISVPVWKITREHQHAVGGEHLEHALKVIRAVGLFDWLGGQINVLKDNLTRPPVEPGCCLPQGPPVFVQPPEERWQPANATLHQHKLKLRKLAEDTLSHQADEVSHEVAHEGSVPLQIAAWVASR